MWNQAVVQYSEELTAAIASAECQQIKKTFEKLRKEWSERQDSNLRRLAPKASALPG